MSKILIFALIFTFNLLFNLNNHITEAKEASSLTEISMDQAKQIALEKINGKIIHSKSRRR